MVTGVISWQDCLDNHQAWDTLTWFAALIALGSALNTEGLIPWFADQVRGLAAWQCYQTELRCCISDSNLQRFTGGCCCPWLPPELAGCFSGNAAHLLLLALPLCVHRGAPRVHVFCVPGCCDIQWSSVFACCVGPCAAVTANGLPHCIWHRVRPSVLQLWIREPERMVSDRGNYVCILHRGLADCWQPVVEASWDRLMPT